MKWAILIIATGHNNLAMNRGVTQTVSVLVCRKAGKYLQPGGR